jgi:3-methyladenine DNA glycosylase/8-oxoguanine DNA glycosylase
VVKLANTFSFVLVPRLPYNFELTVVKPAGWDLFTPEEVYSPHILWTALYIGGLLVGLRLKHGGTTKSPKILVTAFSNQRLTSPQKFALRQAIAAKLGVNDDLSKFYAVAKNDKILRHTIRDLRGMHDTQSGSLFGAAILAICLQMAPLKRSNRMMNCILMKHGRMAEFDGKTVHVWPLPQDVAKLGIERFSKECNLGFRAKYIVQVAKILEGDIFPSLEELSRLSPESAKARLLELPGIGDYSADIISPHAGFPIDVWSAEVFGKLFFGKRTRNYRKIVDRVKVEGIRRWGKWSWMAFLYVANDLENLSKHLKMKLRLA